MQNKKKHAQKKQQHHCKMCAMRRKFMMLSSSNWISPSRNILPTNRVRCFFLDKKNSTFIQIRFAFDSKQRFFFLCFRIVDKIVVELAYLSLVYAYGLGRQWNFCVQLVNVSVCSRASDHPHLLAHSLMSERVEYSTSVEKYIQ